MQSGQNWQMEDRYGRVIGEKRMNNVAKIVIEEKNE